MPETMRAAVLHGREDVRIEEMPVPEPQTGEIVVRVRAALTCGTDVKVFRRGYHARMITPPSVFGHELAGEVVARGREVANFLPGDRVVSSNSAPCGTCFHCDRGQPNLCEDLLFNNGAYAEYLRIPARIVAKNTYHLPESLDYSDAALMEPLACVVQGLRDTPIAPDETIAIIGLGPIGMMFIRLAHERGARVIAVGRRKEQTERALALGADHGVIAEQPEAAVGLVRDIERRGVDLAIEAVGKPELWSAALAMARRGGRVNFFGGCPSGAEVGLNTDLLHYSSITTAASFHHTPATNREALNAIAAGHVRARDFVGAAEPLAAVPAVLAALAVRNGVLKTAIIP